MWRMSMSILVSGWILFTPALWHHRPEQAVLAVLVGLTGFVLSPLAAIRPWAGTAIFALGALRALATFAMPDTLISNVDQLSSGLLLIIAGMYPRLTVIPARAAISEPRAAIIEPRAKQPSMDRRAA
jgi:hypothetical protein